MPWGGGGGGWREVRAMLGGEAGAQQEGLEARGQDFGFYSE